MDADLDTLATGLYVTSDDFLADNPQYRPLRPRVGLAPRLTDAELVTLVVLQALLGFTSEARFLRYANTHLRGLFPYLPTQSGYNKRIRAAIGTLRAVIAHLVARTSSVSDDVWVVDSTPVECGRSRETAKRSDLAGWAEYGYCASHSRFFWGLRLHLVCTLKKKIFFFLCTPDAGAAPKRSANAKRSSRTRPTRPDPTVSPSLASAHTRPGSSRPPTRHR